METTLHPIPQLRDVVREQIRAVGLALRRETHVAIVLVAAMSVSAIIGAVVRHVSLQFQPDSFDAVSLIGLLIPFAAWKGEKPFTPALLWTLPVDRRRLALAKVFAGWVWLMGAIGSVVLWQVVLSLLFEFATAVRWETRPMLWVGQFTASTVMYLIGSALTLGLRHPMRWLFGTLASFFLIGGVTSALGRTDSGELQVVAWSSGLRAAIYGPHGLSTFLNSGSNWISTVSEPWRNLPADTRWATSTLFGLIAGAAMLWAALSRHGERRRR
jgi:hypothetical protein